jgi:hypothetical protein
LVKSQDILTRMCPLYLGTLDSIWIWATISCFHFVSNSASKNDHIVWLYVDRVPEKLLLIK